MIRLTIAEVLARAATCIELGQQWYGCHAITQNTLSGIDLDDPEHAVKYERASADREEAIRMFKLAGLTLSSDVRVVDGEDMPWFWDRRQWDYTHDSILDSTRVPAPRAAEAKAARIAALNHAATLWTIEQVQA